MLDGGSGNDDIWGGLGNDRLSGGNGNDMLTEASAPIIWTADAATIRLLSRSDAGEMVAAQDGTTQILRMKQPRLPR